MVGIYINCKYKDYIKLILDGDKLVETRFTKSLLPYLGKRVGLIETGNDKKILRGYATITAMYHYYNKKEFDEQSFMHCVYEGDPYYWQDGKEKYGFLMEDVVECEPTIITKKGNRVAVKL